MSDKSRAQPPSIVEEIARQVGGTITDAGGPLSDGSGFAIMSMPLPENHWIYNADSSINAGSPPMPFRMGSDWRAIISIKAPLTKRPTIAELEELLQEKGTEGASVEYLANGDVIVGATGMSKRELSEKIKAATRYAVRASTMCGKEMDFDPDAMVQNMTIAMLGYWTDSGLSSDEWENPAVQS